MKIRDIMEDDRISNPAVRVRCFQEYRSFLASLNDLEWSTYTDIKGIAAEFNGYHIILSTEPTDVPKDDAFVLYVNDDSVDYVKNFLKSEIGEYAFVYSYADMKGLDEREVTNTKFFDTPNAFNSFYQKVYGAITAYMDNGGTYGTNNAEQFSKKYDNLSNVTSFGKFIDRELGVEFRLNIGNYMRERVIKKAHNVWMLSWGF